MRFPGSDAREPQRPPRPPGRRGLTGRLALLAAVVVLFFGAGTLISWYVEALWFDSLGYGDVFWKTLGLKSGTFWAFTAVTFVLLFAAFRLLRPVGAAGRLLYLNGQEVTFSLQPVITIASWVVAFFVSLAAGSAMMDQWATFALYLHAPAAAGVNATLDPIFGRSIPFYLFTLPVWDLLATWLTTLAVVMLLASVIAVVVGGASGERLVLRDARRPHAAGRLVQPGVPVRRARLARVPVALRSAVRGSHHLLGRRLHRRPRHHPGAAVRGPLAARRRGNRPLQRPRPAPRDRRRGRACARRSSCTSASPWCRGTSAASSSSRTSWCASGRTSRTTSSSRGRRSASTGSRSGRSRPTPGVEAVDLGEQPGDAREHPAVGLARAAGHAAADPGNPHLLRLPRHRHRSLQDRRRAAADDARRARAERRKLPESSRNWINEKLIYTHGYGVTMNPVNGFTPEGLPQLLLSEHAGAEHGRRSSR